ncbi:MAG: FkbM family methyltransferase [Rhodospirillaceae bacterium]|nr:FkbM family methyltransferase [Rhodospirillaceae bacterium]MBT7265786.1 FkbM family methyltransferase [Rhodospirillaceae bacterium]
MKNIFSSLELADIADRYSLNYFDIGSRGGFQNDLHSLAFAVEVVGFEPDPIEFKHLLTISPEPWKSINYLPFGISGQSGEQNLYIPTDPQSASLMKHNVAIGEKFDKPQFFEVDRIEKIQTLSLNDALEKTKFKSIDFMKIDIEGAEMSVFKSSPEVMKGVLAIKTEISFLPFREDQPLASDIDNFLRHAGFELMDIIEPSHWRRHGYLIHPYYSTEMPPYSRAQIVQADYLYFRNPESVGGDITKLLKLSLIALSFGYFDHALIILELPEVEKFLDSEFKLSPIEIVAPASKIYGRKAFLKAFYQQGRNLIPFLRYMKNLLN